MAPHEQVRFDNNPEIAADIEREKTEGTSGDNSSELSENTRIGQHDEVGPAAEKEASGANGANLDKPGTYDKIEITEEDCYDQLGCKCSFWQTIWDVI